MTEPSDLSPEEFVNRMDAGFDRLHASLDAFNRNLDADHARAMAFVNRYWMARPQYARRGLLRRRWECCIENRYEGFGLTKRRALRAAERVRGGGE